MRVLVCGGRNFDDYNLLHDTLIPFVDYGTTIIEGGAQGADRMAYDFAKWYGIHHEQFPVKWETYGKSAGMIRNKQMLEEGEPDLVIAFPGGKGTANMVKIARAAGIKVLEIDSKNPTD